MVTGMMNYEANPDKQEFFYITINGEEAMTGGLGGNTFRGSRCL